MTKSLRIAIADDEIDMRDYLARVLPRMGHNVVSAAENGRKLVEDCRRLSPDLVITDIRMPELDGVHAAAEIVREHPLPVILISAYHDPDLMADARDVQIQAYLTKPIKQADLAAAIDDVLERQEKSAR